MYLIMAICLALLHLLLAVAIWIPLMVIHLGTKWLGEMNANQIILRIGFIAIALSQLCFWMWLIATRAEGKVPSFLFWPYSYWFIAGFFVLSWLVRKSRLQRFEATQIGCVLAGTLVFVWVMWNLFLIWAEWSGLQAM